MQLADIKWLQVENTTKCNAWCSGCGRNLGGYGLHPEWIDTELDVARLIEVMDQLPNLETVQFCGTYGDPFASPFVMEHILAVVERRPRFLLNTNGSIRNTQFWHDLAKILAPIQHDVTFAIDGLEDTHSFYRQGTDWKKVIDNARSFIDAGGSATWQMIPFKHNEHQIKQCIAMSQQLGFVNFRLVKDVRFPTVSKHYRTGKVIEILPWSLDSKMSKYHQERTVVDPKDCQHLSRPGIYLDSNGELSACCFFNKHRTYKNADEIPDMELEITTSPHRQCLLSCGSCATIDTYDDN